MTAQDHTSDLSYADALRIARGCTDYGGGHRGDPVRFEAYQDGIQTVITALTHADPKDSQTRALMAMGAQPQQPAGWRLVPVEPTPEILAAACLAAWPVASAQDIDLARQAAHIVLMKMDAAPGSTLESIAAAIATMAPAYRAMLAAAPSPQQPAQGQDAKDVKRFEWWFSFDPPKNPNFVNVYLQGMHERWNLDQWRAAIDAAMSDSAGEGGKNG
jgi:hypothetical protein